MVLLGEADAPLHDLSAFFGTEGREELDMLFNVRQAESIFLALAEHSADPLLSHLDVLPPTRGSGQWANFLRNHDELNLAHLPEHYRRTVHEAFGQGEDMQIYGRGLRRRLAAMVGGDDRTLLFCFSLLFWLPGTPVLLYGDEIGMGERRSRDGSRCGCRCSGRATNRLGSRPLHLRTSCARRPSNRMDWSGRTWLGSASTARRCSTRWHGWYGRGRSRPRSRGGRFRTLDTGQEDVLVHFCEFEGRVLVVLHSFAQEERTVDIGELASNLVVHGDLVAEQPYDGSDLHEVHIGGLGYRWIAAVRTQGTERDEREEEPSANPRQADHQGAERGGGT